MVDGHNGDTYHISTESVISIRDLVETLCQRLDRPFEEHVEIVGERLGKDAAYHLESSKIRRELGWADKISLDVGLDECIAWVKQYFDVLKDQPHNYTHKA